MDPIYILLAGRQTLFRKSLKRLMAKMPGFVVVGEAQTAEQMKELLDQRRPDLIIADVVLLLPSKTETIRGLKKQYPGLIVVVRNMFRMRFKDKEDFIFFTETNHYESARLS